MRRLLLPLPPVPVRTGPPPRVEPGCPIGHRWGEGAQSALDYLRHDRLPKTDPEQILVPLAPRRVRRGRR